MNEIHLKVEQGKIYGIFGKNGSGKSILMDIGAGIYLPSSGRVFINGKAFKKLSRIERYRKIAYLPQNSFLPQDVKVKNLIKSFPGLAYGLINRSKLLNLKNEKISSLSGGELRLLELLLIISLNRTYLILDEPFTGIEPLIIQEMIDLILEQRQQKKGILITDHYYHYVLKISDIAYIIKDGQCKPIGKDTDKLSMLKDYGYLSNKST